MAQLTRRTFVGAGAALAATASRGSGPAGAAASRRGGATTSDGVKLSYIEAGNGRPLVMIPGWSQTADEFKFQIDDLSRDHHVFAIDMRGHGESEKVAHGYKIARLAKDVHDVLHQLDLRDVALLGHSMGCSVIWSYWDLFGRERLSKLVLVDQMPFIMGNPAWSEEEKRQAGSILDGKSLYEVYNGLAGPEGAKTTEGFIGTMVTKAMPPEQRAWILSENFKLPRRQAADLIYNHAAQDWRDVIPRIDIPTLVIGGKVSLVPWTSVAWTAQQIRGSRLEIFEENEGGAHFMFVEAPQKFNAILREFLA